MIIKENYYEPHIRELQKKSKGDPGIIERTLYAFGLLEALKSVGLDFIFKGGTSLLLLLTEPKRLSTDIDIVVEPDTDVDAYIDRVSHTFPFLDKGEQTRVGSNNIVKRHFKFTYDSPIKKRPLYILLDVIYEENHYKRLENKSIKNDLLLTEGKDLIVRVPSRDSILGDKMTAFAPYTTGIPIGKGKDLEVIKQFYDVSTLIDYTDDFEALRETYFAVSWTELGYRGSEKTPEDALLDTIRAAVCIGSRGKMDSGDFPYYLKGTQDIVNHIYDRGFSMEVAARMAPKIIYMAACLLTGMHYDRSADLEGLKAEKLTQNDLQTMKAFRKLQTDEYGYLVLADRILQEYRNS